MNQVTPFVITISRELGSGGAYIGQKLAKTMCFVYADREIIRKAAKSLSVMDETLESRDERLLSFWESFLRSSATVPGVYVPPTLTAPTDRQMFDAEASVIENIAKRRSAVIIGRCGFHILREHPNHVSIFLHSDAASRNERVQKLYGLSKEDAAKMIAQKDKERALYCKTFTGKEWADARNYDLSIHTGKIGIDNSVDIILYYLECKIGLPTYR
jgi:cytidylate kinase